MAKDKKENPAEKARRDSGTCRPAWPGEDLIQPGAEVETRKGEKTKVPIIRNDGKMNNDGSPAR